MGIPVKPKETGLDYAEKKLSSFGEKIVNIHNLPKKKLFKLTGGIFVVLSGLYYFYFPYQKQRFHR